MNWDDEVPESIRESWLKWHSELGLLSTKYVPRCYHDKKTSVTSSTGFRNASEQAYSAVVYLRMKCTDGSTQIALVSSKHPSKDSPSLAWSCVELNFSLSSYIMSDMSSTYHSTGLLRGLTAPLYYIGSWEVRSASRLMLATGFPTLWSCLGLSVGVT